MANNWAPEPIKCENGHLFDASGEFLVSPDCVMEQATGDRLAACYNACAEVPTAVLENKGFCKWLLHAVEYQEAKRQMVEKHKEAADGQGDRSPAEAD